MTTRDLRRICTDNFQNNKILLNLLNELTNSDTGDVYLRFT